MFHFKGAVKVGEVYRFDIQVEHDALLGSVDSISSSDHDTRDYQHLFLRVKNTTSALMRPAYLAGPYVLYTAVFESNYRHDTPVGEEDFRPHFDANVKASSSRWQKLPIRPRKSADFSKRLYHLEIASQSIFSPSATTYFDVTLGWTEAEVRKLGKAGKFLESKTPGLEIQIKDTWSLWEMPPVERDHAGHHVPRARVVRPPTIISRDGEGHLCDHLVVLTHGIHSNLTADMLYLKQAIERTSKSFGGRTVCKGFPANACNTERGVRWLGKRVAEWVLNETGWVFEADGQVYRQPNQYKRISFVGHSLGGLVQMYALGWLHDRTYGGFLDPSDIGLQPENFITLATPWLGISAENPPYVKLALDFGVVGKTGQDLGLTVKPLGTYSSYSGPDAAANPANGPAKVHATRPLLRLLSEDKSPCRRALTLFKRRTVYANIENDGIVPLRTSSLFFLDWEGIEASTSQQDLQINQSRPMTPHLATDIESGTELSEVEASPDASVSPVNGMNKSTLPNDSADAPIAKEPSKLSVTGAVRGMGSLIRRLSLGNVKPEETEAKGESSPTSPRVASSEQPDSAKSVAMDQQSQGTMLGVIGNYLKPHGGSSNVNGSSKQNIHASRRKASKAFKRSQTIGWRDEDEDKEPQQVVEPKHTSFLRSLESIVNPPSPDFAFIYDPASRPKQTIVHDRVYKPSDIPPLKPASGSISKAATADSADATLREDIAALDAEGHHTGHRARKAVAEATSSTRQAAVRLEKVRLEERIARNWHQDMDWRKVLVRLLPDAHNNIIVRRRFANSYGWPVIDHLCEHHFGEYVALGSTTKRTTDEEEAEAELEAELERVLSNEQVSLRPSVRRHKSWDAETLHVVSKEDFSGALGELDSDYGSSVDDIEQDSAEREEQIKRMSEVSAGL